MRRRLLHSCGSAVVPPPLKMENNDARQNITDHIFKGSDLHEPERFFFFLFETFTPSNINYGKCCSHKKPGCAFRVSDSRGEIYAFDTQFDATLSLLSVL
ncbi:hypothetical protein DV515_00009827, partial [Chloebia gouldiae]